MFKTAIETKGTTGTRENLYEGCTDLIGTAGAILVRAARPAELVAFWCSWKNMVCAGFAATADEREAISDYRLTA